jgi:hypothetical protein
MIKCTCPECGYRYKVSDELAGRHLSCPECQTRFKVKGAPRARADQDEDDEEDRTPDKVQTIEKTGKKWKAVQLVGVLMMLIGVIGLVVSCAGVYADPFGEGGGPSTRMKAIFSVLGGVLASCGVVTTIIGRVGGWWYHG